MSTEIKQAERKEGELLAQLRVEAMKPSLEAIGRFDPIRAKNRFLESFKPENTSKVYFEGELAGFYVLNQNPGHMELAHLCIRPKYQNKGLGSYLINKVKNISSKIGLPIKLGALKQSESNAFYLSHGFTKVSEAEFDNYYEYKQIHS